jgi:O-antigen/teichoic acid export membrane protein
MKQLGQLGKDTVVYGIGGVLAQSVSLLTILIFTRIFNPSEYGVLEMIVSINSFLSAIIIMGMDSPNQCSSLNIKRMGKENK